jgi:hypothetical protein
MLLGYSVSSLPVAENKGVKRPRTGQVGRERQASINIIAFGTRKRTFMFGMKLMQYCSCGSEYREKWFEKGSLIWTRLTWDIENSSGEGHHLARDG